jgi:hypothetical protein
MKESEKPSALRLLLAAAAACGVFIQAQAGPQDPQGSYTLFMGANISVNLSNGLFPVRDVNGSSWVVDMNGKEQAVSGKEGPINLKIVPVMKLTDVSAVIASFKREPSYSFANDPVVKLTRSQVEAAAIGASYDAASNQAGAIDPSLINPAGASGTSSSGTSVAHGQSSGAAAVASANAGAGASVDLQARQPEQSGFDAMKVEFEISSAKPLQDPYLVTMTRFHPRGSEPGTVQSLVYAKALDPIGTEPAKVTFSEEGFPFDYEVVDFQLHLYNEGVEVATNIADKREVMTLDQAFDYVKKAYIESHKGESMHAVAVMGELPKDISSHIAAGNFGDTVYVKVNKDGFADQVYADYDCSKRISDPYLETVVRSIRFKPALADGIPVEGVASLKLGHPGS